MGEVRLRLFVRGTSRRLVSSVRARCDELFGPEFRLDVIDVDEDPQTAKAARILATPTLLVEGCTPGRVVGDLLLPGALSRLILRRDPRAVSA